MTRKALPDLTNGPIVKTLITLSIPIVFANILQTAYQLVDIFWVDRLSAEAVAAVSLSFPILFLLISLAGGLAIAGTIMVSQYKGKGDIEKVDFISAQTLLMMFIVAIISSIIGLIFSAPLMALMGSGNTTMSMIIAIIAIFVIQFPVAFILSKFTTLGAEGIFWAFPITNILTAIISILWLRTGSWKKKQITKDILAGKVV